MKKILPIVTFFMNAPYWMVWPVLAILLYKNFVIDLSCVMLFLGILMSLFRVKPRVKKKRRKHFIAVEDHGRSFMSSSVNHTINFSYMGLSESDSIHNFDDDNFEFSTINPATGLPMSGSLDIGGNVYGVDNSMNKDIDSISDFSSSCDIDDPFR